MAKERIANDVTVNKKYKARPGYKLLATDISDDKEFPTNFGEGNVVGKKWCWMEDGQKKLCYLIEVPEEVWAGFTKDFERVKKDYTNATRCLLESKNGKYKMCPHKAEFRMDILRELYEKGRLDDEAEAFLKSGQTFTCENCPLPSYCKVKVQEISAQSENGPEVASHGYGTAEYMERSVPIKELLTYLKKMDPIYLKFVKIRFNNPDYTPEETWTKLGIGSTKYYRIKAELLELGNEYIDISY